MRKNNLKGMVFGRLFVVGESGKRLHNRVTWVCLCECGKYKAATGHDLNQDKIVSCGCHKRELTIERNKKRTGGKIKCNGYWLIYTPLHPLANAMGRGYVRQGRIVMEKYLERYLDPDEIVHHINHQKDDDRIENLELMTNSSHLSYHSKMQRKQRDSLGRFI